MDIRLETALALLALADRIYKLGRWFSKLADHLYQWRMTGWQDRCRHMLHCVTGRPQ